MVTEVPQAISISAYLCLSGWEGVTAGHRETERLPASSPFLLQGLALQVGLYQAGRAYSVRLSVWTAGHGDAVGTHAAKDRAVRLFQSFSPDPSPAAPSFLQ